jgi:microcystin-dependent protein
MSLPYVGEIRLFAGNFAPAGWAFCDGQLLSIAENDVLFELIGTTYGGDGQQTFALPDMRGRVPLHQGTGQSSYGIGQAGGAETVALTSAQIPPHTHGLRASTQAATLAHDGTEALGASTKANYYGAGDPTLAMDAKAMTSIGQGHAHNNLAPFVALNYIISLFGVFPSQN